MANHQILEKQAVQALGASAFDRVKQAIHKASAATGVDFAYLMNKAAQESSFRPDIKAKSSSATGLFQFIEQTWLRMVKAHGDKHGLEGVADKIRTRADGTAYVSDRALRQQILELRKNPEMAAAMAAELANENKEVLEDKAGGKIGGTELYLAHFLGAGAAVKFVKAQRNDPQAVAAHLFPEAAAANPNVFYDKTGRAKTLAQIYDRFDKLMGREPVGGTPARMVAQGEMTGKREAESGGLAFAAGMPLPSGRIFEPVASPVSPGWAAQKADPQSLFATMMLAQLDTSGASGITHVRDDEQDKDRRAAART